MTPTSLVWHGDGLKRITSEKNVCVHTRSEQPLAAPSEKVFLSQEQCGVYLDWTKVSVGIGWPRKVDLALS